MHSKAMEYRATVLYNSAVVRVLAWPAVTRFHVEEKMSKTKKTETNPYIYLRQQGLLQPSQSIKTHQRWSQF